jgi:hypothetical protein
MFELFQGNKGGAIGSDVTGSYVTGSRVTGRGYVRNRKYVMRMRNRKCGRRSEHPNQHFVLLLRKMRGK